MFRVLKYTAIINKEKLYKSLSLTLQHLVLYGSFKLACYFGPFIEQINTLYYHDTLR
jgi:hypothetical protein